MIPDWVRQLPPERQAQLIAEQQRMFQAMMDAQARQAYPLNSMMAYLNAQDIMQPSKPCRIYIAGQVIDGSTGRIIK